MLDFIHILWYGNHRADPGKRRAGSPPGRYRGALSAHFKEDITMEAIVNLLGNYVFPIAMCLILMWKMERDTERYREDLNAMRTVIEKNTEILAEIKTMLADNN